MSFGDLREDQINATDDVSDDGARQKLNSIGSLLQSVVENDASQVSALAMGSIF